MSARVWLRRAYEMPASNDGYRALVDRLWPRGVSREQIKIDAWPKDVAPSSALRQWYGHRPERWHEFRERYLRELDAEPAAAALNDLVHRARTGRVTLVFGARDVDHSHAQVIREAVESKLSRQGGVSRRP